MLRVQQNSVRSGMSLAALLVALAILFTGTLPTYAGKKKEEKKEEVPLWKQIDFSKIVWPNPPAITRVRYLDYFATEKYDQPKDQKSGWMDRLAGVAAGENKANKPLFQLMSPYGMGVDSKNRLYVADGKVGAVFVFNTETRDVELIKNGTHARFGLITGVAIDDSDRLFVSDSVAKRVLIFEPNHRLEGTVSDGMASPAGIAIDNENRYLYVCDTELDQVLVYNADAPYQLIRKMGAPNSKHELTSPGDFSRPTNAAVDQDGNLYVSDTFNDRVEVFDADGNFVRTWGKAGDGPGYFARPKGIAIDSDGHVWVADTVQDRLQVFTNEGHLLLWMGGHGLLPGQFSAIQGLAIDKNDRVFASEQYIGRVQMFRYINDETAKAEKAKRDAETQKKSIGKPAQSSTESSAAKTTAANAQPQAPPR